MSTLDFATGLVLVAIVLSICYVILIRPQRTRLLKLQKLTSNLEPGDQIVTAGGIMGTVVRDVDPNTVVVNVAHNVEVSVRRNLINDVIRMR
jgi:preprotein translocase subunit YajC